MISANIICKNEEDYIGYCIRSVLDDVDADGLGLAEDCDDFNPLTNPGAPEICGNDEDNMNTKLLGDQNYLHYLIGLSNRYLL